MKQLPLYKESETLRLSVSKVKTYDHCKKQYYFNYILKLPQKDFEFHTLGKTVHLILELFHSTYINGSSEPKHKVMGRAYKKALSLYSSKLTKESRKEIYDIIDSYLQKVSKEQKPDIIAVERNFNVHIADRVVLNGMIDRVQLDKDGVLHVIDYKSTKNPKYLKDDFLQLLTYAYILAEEDSSIEKVRGSYVMLRHNFEYITKEFSRKEIEQIKSKYEGYAASIGNQADWNANVGPLCNYCSFLSECEEGKAFITKDIGFGQTDWS